MSNQNALSALLVPWVAALGLAIFLATGLAGAQSSSASYAFLFAAGFLCDSGDSSACPAVVKSANGDSYEMSGAGTFTTQSKAVTAVGTFTHKSSDGLALDTGVWVASELVSFDSYGIAPAALRREGRTLGPPQFGPMHSRMLAGPIAAGGLAVFRIRLLPMHGLAKNATLQVNCALAKVPPEHAVEGIRLAIEGGSAEFDEEVSGRAMFLWTRPGAAAPAQATTPAPDTNPAPPAAQE